MNNERLMKQIEFIVEIDRLKQIYRQNYLADASRKENDAEHSWHLAVMAFLLSEHSIEKNADVLRIMKMVLVHDLVEIDAGDTYCYDEKANEDKCEREIKAADRLFNILPEDQAKEFRALWDEFEERKTAEARFAAALDRVQPVLLNYTSRGKSWQEHGITTDKALKRNRPVEDGSVTLWDFVKGMLDDAVKKGYMER